MVKTIHLQNKRIMKNLIFLFFLSILLLIGVLPVAGQIANDHHPRAINNNAPSLCFSTFFGGISCEISNEIAVSSDGCFYMTGYTESNDFPVQNAFNDTYGDNLDAFVTKFNNNGSLLWSTYLGGSETDRGYGIAVAADGSCYVTGWTDSSDFPTKNANDSTYNGANDAFITKFSTNGSLLWSTFLGGSHIDHGYSIALAEDGSCYIIGETWSSDFPIKNASDSTHSGGNNDAFIAKLSSNGSLLWSTFLGGNSWDRGYGIAVASDGNCFVTGYTSSSNFPTMNAYDDIFKGPHIAFVAKFTSSGSLNWSTFIGGDDSDTGEGIALGRDNSCYVTGNTYSANFPTKNAYDSGYNSGGDAFVVKFSNNGSLLFSTYLGGYLWDRGKGIVVAGDGNCYVTGDTDSPNFPTVNVDNNFFSGERDAFVAKFSSDGLLWSRCLGGNGGDWGKGIAVAFNTTIYVTGYTYSTNFPTVNAYDSEIAGCSDNFVAIYNGIDIPITSPPQNTSRLNASGFLASIIVMPIILFIFRKRRK